jgi:hypothetical protein
MLNHCFNLNVTRFYNFEFTISNVILATSISVLLVRTGKFSPILTAFTLQRVKVYQVKYFIFDRQVERLQ